MKANFQFQNQHDPNSLVYATYYACCHYPSLQMYCVGILFSIIHDILGYKLSKMAVSLCRIEMNSQAYLQQQPIKVNSQILQELYRWMFYHLDKI